MMLNVNTYLVFTICALGALVAAMAGEPFADAVAAVGHDTAHDQLSSSQFHNVSQHLMQARDDAPPPWDSQRMMVLGIGSNGQNVGTKGRYFLYDIIKGAVGDLCPSGQSGVQTMRSCNTEKVVTQEYVVVKNKNGDTSRDGSYTIKVGSSYFGLPGAREILIDAIAWTMYTIMDNQCWKPGFNGDASDWDLCKAPDITMVRIDYIGWLVVFIKADAKDMNYPHDMRVCAQEGWATGEVKDKVEKKIKEEMKAKKWHEPLKLKSAEYLSVETSCYINSTATGQGDGWCRKDAFEYMPGTDCPPTRL